MSKAFYKRGICVALSVILLVLGLAACGQQAASSESVPPDTLPPKPQIVSSVPPPPPPPPPPQPRRKIDFDVLQAQNEDVVAWVEVPGTVIDYPIMSTTDNAFYLDHDELKNYSKFGAIFIDMSNPHDFSYPMMVAYGHYTPEDTHFTQLHKYEDTDYFAENRDVYVYLPGAQNRYEIVAALFIGDENILYEKDYRDKEIMEGFLASLENSEDAAANVNLDGASADDSYIVLSTCTQAEYWSDQRYVVVARLAEEMEIPAKPVSSASSSSQAASASVE